jgi:chemotaxis protein CheD
MNHFLLPLWNGDGLPTPKYGNIAIDRLLEKLLLRGANRATLIAKVFGGASMWAGSGGLLAVGERNVELAKAQLDELRIPIVGADLGGRVGRKVIFNTATGEVWMQRHQERR